MPCPLLAVPQPKTVSATMATRGSGLLPASCRSPCTLLLELSCTPRAKLISPNKLNCPSPFPLTVPQSLAFSRNTYSCGVKLKAPQTALSRRSLRRHRLLAVRRLRSRLARCTRARSLSSLWNSVCRRLTRSRATMAWMITA
eukprot:Rmarinus@m.22805